MIPVGNPVWRTQLETRLKDPGFQPDKITVCPFVKNKAIFGLKKLSLQANNIISYELNR